MLVTDRTLIAKRNLKKNLSYKFAKRMLAYLVANRKKKIFKDLPMEERMMRQLGCSSCMFEYPNGLIKTTYCKQKTCLVCNSIRLAKFLTKYLDGLTDGKIIYHMVLTVRNPGRENLRQIINKMFKFFNNSSIKKDKEFRRLNKLVGMIRSFETTLNEKEKTYHIHFHILLSGDNEKDIIAYGRILKKYWLKYFGNKAHTDAQYFDKQKKNILENFKYLFKLKDISDSNIEMIYHLLKATLGKRLFLAKNINYDKEKIKRENENWQLDSNDIEYEKIYRYDFSKSNWIDPDTGELLTKSNDFEILKDVLSKNNFGESSQN